MAVNRILKNISLIFDKRAIFSILFIISLYPGCSAIYRSVKHNLEESYREAKREYRSGNYKHASSIFHEIESTDPEFRDVHRMSVLSDRESDRYIISLYRDAKSYQARKREVDALIKLQELKTIRKNYEDVDQRIEEMLKNERVKKEEDRLIKKGDDEKKKNKLLKARSFYTDILRFHPGQSEAKKHISVVQSELSKEAKKFFAEGAKFLKAAQIQKAVTELRKAVEYDPEEKDYSVELQKAEDLRSNIAYYDKGADFFKKQNYLNAYEALLHVSDYKDSGSLRNKAKTEALANISSYLDQAKALYNDNKLKESVVQFDKILLLDSSQTEAAKYKEQAEKKIETLKNFE